jgi:SAM-dependent methyltransferase
MSSVTPPCKICHNAYGNTAYTAREMMYGLRDTFAYFQCADCGCLQIAEFPADMSRYYPGHYYSFQAYDGKKFKGLKGALKRRQYRAAVFRTGLEAAIWTALWDVPDYRLLHSVGLTRATRVLDVGCGNGNSFLYPLAEVGLTHLLGCDPYLDAPIHYPNGLRIQNTAIAEVTGQWDLITFHHSFEHVPDPQANMDAVARLLAPGGVCIIRVPTCSSHAWEHYRTHWAQLDAPRHFFLHSRESMRRVGAASGLELYQTIDDSRHFQFSGSEKLLADQHLATARHWGPLGFLRRRLRKLRYTRMARQLNAEGRGDQAAFFFRKG